MSIEIKEEDLEYLGRVSLPEEQHLLAVKMIEEADKEIEQMRIQFRWGSAQIELLKKAAALMGLPYQTYIKQALYHKIIEDLNSYPKEA